MQRWNVTDGQGFVAEYSAERERITDRRSARLDRRDWRRRWMRQGETVGRRLADRVAAHGPGPRATWEARR